MTPRAKKGAHSAAEANKSLPKRGCCGMLHAHPTGFPCVVYFSQAHGGYAFGHYCSPASGPVKLLPASLRVRDLQEHARQPALPGVLRKACFLVLVTGDVAQCVSVNTAGDRNRTRFLFRGSEYATPSPCPPQGCSEFHEDYVHLPFHSTLSTFRAKGGLVGVQNMQCGIALFPRRIRDTDIATLARWVDQSITKMAHGSVWLTEKPDSYSEQGARRKRRRVEEPPTHEGFIHEAMPQSR